MKDFVDDLYRRASEDPDIPFNEEAWDQMDLKLDQAARKRRRGLFWLFLFLVVTLSAGLLWGTGELKKPQQKIVKEKYSGPVAGNTQDKNQKNKAQPTQESALNVPGQKQLKDSSSAITKIEDQNQGENVNQTGNQTDYSPKTTTRLFTNQQQGARKPTKSRADRKPGLEAPKSNQNTRKFVEDLAVVSPPINENGSIVDSTLMDIQSGFAHFSLEPLPETWTYKELKADQFTGIIINGDYYTYPSYRPVTSTQPKSWGIGLSAGPDLASVNANGSTATGLNAGLAFDYRIGKRWVFQAAGQYLLKNYIADQKEYVAPSGFWPTRSYPSSTEGTCDMLQWSVDLRYNWLAKPKWKSFIMLGSSSWTILNEKYEFYYARDYPGLIYNWSSKQNKNYWLSMAQMGIGVEKTIRPGLSLQVNWFAQMPLQGVGNGKVEIYSSGLGFMVHKQMGKFKQ